MRDNEAVYIGVESRPAAHVALLHHINTGLTRRNRFTFPDEVPPPEDAAPEVIQVPRGRPSFS